MKAEKELFVCAYLFLRLERGLISQCCLSFMLFPAHKSASVPRHANQKLNNDMDNSRNSLG